MTNVFSLEEYAAIIEGLALACYSCGKQFPSPVFIEHRDHSGGWWVRGFTLRQWLWVTCNSCKSQVALWKIGIGGSKDHTRYANEALARARGEATLH